MKLPTAAAVFEVGTFTQSPTPKTFGNLVDWRVFWSTSNQPVASANLLSLIGIGAIIGGVMWSISYWNESKKDS